MNPNKVSKYIGKSARSNIARSSRRLLFNYLEESVESRGYFHVDQMYGAGSGVLLKILDDFFLLTAKHVINNNIDGSFQNESPFWMPVKSEAEWTSLYDFLFPKRIWNIGELIYPNEGFIDLSDICLVELFYPQMFHMPDNFIEIKDENNFLTEKEFFDGQLLLATGYPIEQNYFDFTPISESISHTTNIQRHTIPGVYVEDEYVGYISFEIAEGNTQHENVNGMSGGAIYNVKAKGNQVKLAGMPVTAGDNVCRFIPSYIFLDAVKNFKRASCKVVDPRADTVPSLDESIEFAFSYLKKHGPRFDKYRRGVRERRNE